MWKHGVFAAFAVALTASGCRASFPLSLLDRDGGADRIVGQDARPRVDAARDGAVPDARAPDAAVVDGAVTADAQPPDAQPPDAQPPDAQPVDAPAWVCGDGTLDSGEACDDGNTISGDGCSSQCEIECSNGSTSDCNYQGETLVPGSAFVDQHPPDGFIQCAGFRNSPANDVGSHWDGNCLGAVHVLRIRYWDTSTNPWTLLGDAILSPELQADFSEQTFDATNVAGSEGVAEQDGFTLLPDDPAGPQAPTTEWRCDTRYGATDLYFANKNGDKFILVSGYSLGDATGALMDDRDEIVMYGLGYEQCSQGAPSPSRRLAVALYFER